ncbi:hypothetical protein BASU617_16870 [Bacillus subtilis]
MSYKEYHNKFLSITQENDGEKNGTNIVRVILSYSDETKNRFNDSNIFSLIWQPEPVSEKITYHHYLRLINMSGLI